MYTLAVVLLLGLALCKIVDVLDGLVPGLARLRGLATLALAVAVTAAMDYSLFAGFGVELREAWMGTVLTGAVLAGTTSVWRAAFNWLGWSEGEAEALPPRRRGPVSRAA